MCFRRTVAGCAKNPLKLVFSACKGSQPQLLRQHQLNLIWFDSMADNRTYVNTALVQFSSLQSFVRVFFVVPADVRSTRKTVLDRGSRSDRPRYRVTTPTLAGLCRCRWPRPRHAARLTALARSWWGDNRNLLLRPSVNTHSTPQ